MEITIHETSGVESCSDSLREDHVGRVPSFSYLLSILKPITQVFEDSDNFEGLQLLFEESVVRFAVSN